MVSCLKQPATTRNCLCRSGCNKEAKPPGGPQGYSSCLADVRIGVQIPRAHVNAKLNSALKSLFTVSKDTGFSDIQGINNRETSCLQNRGWDM